MKSFILFSIFFTLLFVSCEKKSCTNSTVPKLVEVEFHLQTGFDDEDVRLKIDDKIYLSTQMSRLEPIAGP